MLPTLRKKKRRLWQHCRKEGYPSHEGIGGRVSAGLGTGFDVWAGSGGRSVSKSRTWRDKRVSQNRALPSMKRELRSKTYMPAILVLRERLRQEDQKFKTTVGRSGAHL